MKSFLPSVSCHGKETVTLKRIPSAFVFLLTFLSIVMSPCMPFTSKSSSFLFNPHIKHRDINHYHP